MREPKLREEAFGPGTLVVRCRGVREAASGVRAVGGSLTGTVHVGEREDAIAIKTVISALEEISGRVIVNGYPTGVEVNHAIVHGGPYPATTDPGTTSVGTAAIHRFTRLIAYQDAPQSILPPELKDENPLKILRRINGALAHDVIPPIMGAAR
jgi:NADP-dependent aldehyde dehydrogenase